MLPNVHRRLGRLLTMLPALLAGTLLAACNGVTTVDNPPAGTAAGSVAAGSAAGVGSGSGTVTVSWTAPTTNTDGSALTDLAGYHIYYGTDTQQLGQIVNVPTVGLTTYVIDGFAPGTYYFAVASYTSTGVESSLSEVVGKTV